MVKWSNLGPAQIGLIRWGQVSYYFRDQCDLTCPQLDSAGFKLDYQLIHFGPTSLPPILNFIILVHALRSTTPLTLRWDSLARYFGEHIRRGQVEYQFGTEHIG